MSTPLVSVGMPVYNGETYLRESLESWLAQAFDDFELIVCDNASTDATPEILREYAARDSRVRVMTRTENVIAWENYMGLLPESKAPLFTWAACDDLRDPTFLSRMVQALSDDPEAILSFCPAHYFGDETRMKRHQVPEGVVAGTQATKVARISALLRAHEWISIYGLIRKDVLERTRLFVWPLGFCGDQGLVMELAAHGRFHCVREPLMSFRFHPKALSMDLSNPIHGGRSGRLYDEPSRDFVYGLPLTSAELKLVEREVKVWCRKAQKPRVGLWKSGVFRSGYARALRLSVDLSRGLQGL